MTTRAIKELQELLGPIDPGRGESLSSPQQRQADLEQILTVVPLRAARRPRRSLLVAAAVGVTVVLVAVIGYQVVPLPQPAYAATPAALAYSGGGGPAEPLLVAIAERAKAAPGPAGRGDHEHLTMVSWDLWSQIDGERVTSAVVPTRTESWRGPNNSGRIMSTHTEPQFPSRSDRWLWRLHGSPGGDRERRISDYQTGRFPAMWPDKPPASGMAAWLRIGHPVTNGPAETLVAVTDLVRERVLSPAQRADVLQTVAKLPQLRYDGQVTDRAGRQGSAFSVESDYSGLPTRYTLIVDPSTGAILGYESVLTTSAGKLDVRIPAVVTYQTYVVAELSDAPG